MVIGGDSFRVRDGVAMNAFAVGKSNNCSDDILHDAECWRRRYETDSDTNISMDMYDNGEVDVDVALLAAVVVVRRTL